jgi:asparagine synthetase B (glutamine-hydrolysing)
MAQERELAAYRRELTRLLREGEVGRFALVHGDAVVSVWDTRRDAVQAGRDKFGAASFLVQQIHRETRSLPAA